MELSEHGCIFIVHNYHLYTRAVASTPLQTIIEEQLLLLLFLLALAASNMASGILAQGSRQGSIAFNLRLSSPGRPFVEKLRSGDARL